MARIKLIIADDNEEIRNHLCEIIVKESDDIDVIGLAKSGRESIELTRELVPDVVLMDVQMETRTAGIEAIEQINGIYPGVKCIMLTIHENEEYMFRAYMAGAVDYIVKTDPTQKIVKSIHDVIDNRLLLRPEVAHKIINEYHRIKETHVRMKETLQVMMMISTTEYEILQMVYNGYTYKNIAEKRYVEETTIRSQVNHILKKFGKKRMKDVIDLLRELKIFDKD